MKRPNNLDGILRRTRQVRMSEPGLQHFSVVTQRPKVIEPKPIPEVKSDWVYQTVFGVIAVALVFGLIAVLQAVWG